MLKVSLLVFFCLAAAQAQRQHYHLVPTEDGQPRPVHQPAQRVVQHDESPKPYSFNYDAVGEDGGASSRQENADGSGRVTGSYRLQDPDGRIRLVQYVADAAGFRANVETNEEGTESQNPADVNFQSSAPTAYELVQRYASHYAQRPVVRPHVVPEHRPVVHPTTVQPAPVPAPAPHGPVHHRPVESGQQPVTTVINGRRYILVPVYE